MESLEKGNQSNFERDQIDPRMITIETSLMERCLVVIEKNLHKIPSFSHIPPFLLQKIIDMVMFERKLGSRNLTNDVVSKFFVEGLVELDLNSFWCADSVFLQLKCPELINIDLSGCLPVGDTAVKQLGLHSPKLKILKLKGTNGLTSISALENCPLIEDLELNAQRLSEKELSLIPKFIHLKRLRLDRATSLKPELISTMANQLKMLSSLSLQGCPMIGDDAIQSISKFPLLELRLSDCPLLKTPDWKNLNLMVLEIKRCSNLQSLSNISVQFKLSIKDLSGKLSLVHVLEKNMKTLLILKAEFLKRTDAETFFLDSQPPQANWPLKKFSIYMTQLPLSCLQWSHFSALEKLNLNDTATDSQILARLSKNCPLLKVLSLAECHLIRDSDLDYFRHFSFLEELNLSKCLKLTRNALLSHPTLNYLKVCGLSSVFQLNLPNLQIIDFSYTHVEVNSLKAVLESSGALIKNFWAIDSKFSDPHIELLQFCPLLSQLNLSNNSFSLSLLPPLIRTHKTLRRIYLNDTCFESSDIDLLSKRFPYCFISATKIFHRDKKNTK